MSVLYLEHAVMLHNVSSCMFLIIYHNYMKRLLFFQESHSVPFGSQRQARLQLKGFVSLMIHRRTNYFQCYLGSALTFIQ